MTPIQIFFAVLGGVAALIGTTIAIINIWRDRAIITLKPTHFFNADLTNPKGRFMFTVEIVNHGRRSIYIEEAGIEIPITNKVPVPFPEGSWGHTSTLNFFPRKAGESVEIKEGQKITLGQDPFPADFISVLGKTAVCYVKSTRGKVYREKFHVTSALPRN